MDVMRVAKKENIEKAITLCLIFCLLMLLFLTFFTQYGFPVISSSPIYAQADFSLSGSGTEQDPFLIGTVNELLELSNKVNHPETPEETQGIVFALSDDIDMSEMEEGVQFYSIGTASHPFAGKFLGKYGGVPHVISNLTTTGKGLFGYTANTAVIEGLGVANAQIGDDSMVSEVGGIVGTNLGTIRYCFFYGTVEGINSVGGIAGVNGSENGTSGDIDTCYSSGSIIASGVYVGGIVGKNYRRISGTYSLSKISSAYWPGVNYNGNIGGVIGGRMNTNDSYNSTPLYSYFNKDNNYTNLNAIGYGTSKDSAPVPDNILASDYRFSGLNSADFQDKSLTELFGQSYEASWQKGKYLATYYSAWYAPVIKNYVPSVSGFLQNYFFKNSVAIRRYGYTHNEYEWGTENNPYLIENTSHFSNLALAVQNSTRPETYLGKVFLQTADLNFSGVTPTIIGRRHETVNPFSGTYDGGNHSILNFDLSQSPYVTQTYVGLFGYLSSNGTLKNIILDGTCKFVGRSFVGSLVGFSQGGTVRNIVSRSEVSASIDYGGGVIGQADGGSYSNIISDVSFSEIDPLLISKHKGIFGVSVSTALTNVWYLDNPLKSAGVSGTSGQGNVIHLSATYGNVSASMDAEGQITFTATPLPGWDSSYRTISEEIISSGNNYSPLISETRRNLDYYLRFVKEISVTKENLLGADVLVNSVAVPSLTSKYWVGQRFAVTVDISDTSEGYYVHDSLFFDEEENLLEQPEYITYFYDNYQKKISLRTEMMENLASVCIVIERISLTAGAFPSPRTYTGEEVYAFNQETDLAGGGPEGFTALVDYYGVLPINVTNNGKYAVVYSKDGIVRGKLDKEYVITPKQLTVVFTEADHSVVDTVKEFDGIGGVDSFGDRIFQSTEVVQEKVNGIASVDSSNFARLEVTAEISYAAPDVSPNETINVQVRFALRGSSKDNYIVPESVEGPYGGISKRVIKVVVESSLSKQYDGLSPSPPLVYYIDYRSSTFPKEMELKKAPSFSYSPEAGIVSPNSGEYLLSVTFGDVSDGNIFEIYFSDPENPEGTLEQLSYYILPRACQVTYIGFDESKYVPESTGSLVYNPSRIMSYSAEFSDIEGNKHALTLEHWENGSAMAGNPFEGGEYTSYVQEGLIYGLDPETEKNYYLANPSINFVILRAEQSLITITLPDDISEIDFTDTVELNISGGSGTGEVTFSSGLGPNGEDPTGTCTILEDILTPSKAGLVYLTATKAESRNYNEALSSIFYLTINKVSMDLSLDSAEIIYGNTYDLIFRFNGNLTPVPTGFIPPTVSIISNDFSADYDSETMYNADEYELVMSQDASSDGYEFTIDELVEISFNVLKMNVSIIADDKTHVYGEEEAALTFTLVEEIGEGEILGDLVRDPGLDCGEYAINIGNLIEVNPNYEIAFTPGVYSITPAGITIRIDPKTKLFGAPDPIPTYSVEGLKFQDTIESIELEGTVLRALGENAYKQGISSPYADYSYYAALGELAFRHNSSNYSEVITVVNATLRILPVSPEFLNIIQVRTRYGNTLSQSLYGTAQSSEMPALAEARGRQYFVSQGRWEEIIIPGTFSWKNDKIKPSFVNSATFIAEAIFNPSDRNYKVSSFNISVLPIRVSLNLRFTGENTFEYDGNNHKEMTYEFTGVLGNDGLFDSISYNGDVVNAGEYRATVTIANGNYFISNTNNTTITIEKKELIISHPNIKLPLNGTVQYMFGYEGFVEGEDPSNLERLPEIEFDNSVGVQEGVYPSGARADNYYFTYMPLDVTVLAIQLQPVSSNTDIRVTGVFEEGIECICAPVTSGLDYKNNAGKFEAAKLKYSEIINTKINSMFLIKFIDSDGEPVSESGVSTMTLTLSEDQVNRYSEFKFFGVSSSGDMVLLDAPELNGNEVTFEVQNLVSVMFLEPETETFNMLYLYIGVGSAVALVGIFIAISAAIKFRNKRRIIRFKDE
jgi:hypothetical protein